MFKKIVLISIMALVILVVPQAQNKVKAAECTGSGIGYSIECTFPDPNMAQAVANKITASLGDTTHIISQTDIDLAINWDLSGKNITNIEGIKHFTNLNELNLGSNKLTSIPDSIDSLSNLTELYLYINTITSIPNSIGNLSNLKILWLNNNLITNIPDSLGNLSNLSELYLNQNQLASLPETIGNLSSLTNLILYQNQFTNMPDSIGNLSNLKVLSLASNKLTSLPNSIGNLSSLTDLRLSRNNLETIPQSIGNLSSLTDLFLEINQITSVPESIGNLSNLKILRLNNNKITTIPESYVNLSKIIDLNLNTQQVVLRDIPYSNPIILVNPIVGHGANPMTFTNISHNGVQQGNNLEWHNLEDIDQILSFDFSQSVSIGSATSNLSGTATKGVRKQIEISTLDINQIEEVTYNGLQYTPLPLIFDGMTQLILNTDFEVSYENNINAGNATVHIKGLGFYKGTSDITFRINKAIPTVQTLPNASKVDKGNLLKSSILSGGSMQGVNIHTVSTKALDNVEGTFTWISPTIRVYETKKFEVLFKSNNANYQNTRIMVQVSLNNKKTTDKLIFNKEDKDLPNAGISSQTILFSISFIIAATFIIIYLKKRNDKIII